MTERTTEPRQVKHKKPASSNPCKGAFQRAAIRKTELDDVPPVVYDVLRTPGRPLDAPTRAFMESRFEHDFSGVRVHTDAQAAESAQAVSARAYTVGREVVFGASEYAPRTTDGQRLVAHELTHVIQQSITPYFGKRPIQVNSSKPVEEIEACRNETHIFEAGKLSASTNRIGTCVQRNERADSPGSRSSLLRPCTRGNESQALSSAFLLAQRCLGDAVSGLQDLISIWGNPPVTARQRGTARALASGFNIAFDKSGWVDLLGINAAEVEAQDARDRAAVRVILRNFEQIRSDLPNYSSPPACSTRMVSGSPCFGCIEAEHGRCRRGSIAFVPPEFIGRPSSAILFCPAFFNDLGNSMKRAEALIHEMAHLQRFAASDILGGYRYYGCPVVPISENLRGFSESLGPGLRQPAEFIQIADSYRCFIETQQTLTTEFSQRMHIEHQANQLIDESLRGP